ncbi:hypothetical protein PR048_007649 [Dryococelus australis]|uniref:Uncharacterized protein n=1 Tax=Dryococelus australis TaxID=614101 RepID=A0ABQ9HUT8_9NEOP|nr:hypothetical protein PR048_007649 [Dryococelus australis]
MRINILIGSTCKAMNWRAVLPSIRHLYETFDGYPTIHAHTMRVSEEIWKARNSEVLRADSDSRENPPTKEVARHDSPTRKSGVTQPEIEPGSPWWEARWLTTQLPWPQPSHTILCQVHIHTASLLEDILLSLCRGSLQRLEYSELRFLRRTFIPCPRRLLALLSDVFVGMFSVSDWIRVAVGRTIVPHWLNSSVYGYLLVRLMTCSMLVSGPLNYTVLYVKKTASFLHWLLHRCEANVFLTDFHAIGALNCEGHMKYGPMANSQGTRNMAATVNRQLGSHRLHSCRATVSLLASNQGDTGSIHGRATPDFRMWESCLTMPLFGGFSRGSPVPPALPFQRRSTFTSITHIASQDLDGLTSRWQGSRQRRSKLHREARTGQKAAKRTIPALAWSDFGKPRGTEIRTRTQVLPYGEFEVNHWPPRSKIMNWPQYLNLDHTSSSHPNTHINKQSSSTTQAHNPGTHSQPLTFQWWPVLYLQSLNPTQSTEGVDIFHVCAPGCRILPPADDTHSHALLVKEKAMDILPANPRGRAAALLLHPHRHTTDLSKTHPI